MGTDKPSQAPRFKEQKSKELEQDEARLADLKKFELDLENSLNNNGEQA